MYWANFLHIYQPPTQRPSILKRVVGESYRRLVAELERAPAAKLTLNIPGCLTDLLVEHGHKDVVEGLGRLLAGGRLELTATAKYHPLLPKLPENEIRRQIKLDLDTNRKHFGRAYQPRGFFPPEAAYDRRLAKIVASMGFEWVLAEELSLSGKFGSVRYDRVYEVAGADVRAGADSAETLLKIFFRERETSFKILSGQLGTIKLFEDHLGRRLAGGGYLLTAMDGETFGHHRPGMEKLLFEIYRAPQIKTVTVSELIDLYPRRETVETRPATWALMEKDLEKKVPFSRWDDPGNDIHRLQWRLTRLALAAVARSRFADSQADHKRKGPSSKRKQWRKARRLLDQALHSDQYWWASARPWWSLEMIEGGAKELRDVVFAVPDASERSRRAAERLYYGIITTGFDWQRLGKIEEISRREDEEIRERTDKNLPKLPKREVKKMIDNIRREMEDVAVRQEYERAAQLRDRIGELEEYMRG